MMDLELKIKKINQDYKRLEKKKKAIQLIKLKNGIRKNNITKND